MKEKKKVNEVEPFKPYKDHGSIVTKQWILDKFAANIERAKIADNVLHVFSFILINLVERIEKLEAKK